MSKLKVAHLVPNFNIGGTERVILDLCLHGREEQKVVSCADGAMRPVFEQHGIPVQIGQDRAQLAHYLSEADVVNVHWLCYMPEVFQTVLAAGRPLVCTLHWLSVLPELPGLVICVSRQVYDLQEPNRERRVLIPNGIDTHRFQPCRGRRQRSEQTRLIRVCRPEKCADYFWPAVSQVLEACFEAELTVVGGPACPAGRIQCLGYRHDVDQLLAASDLFAYTPRPGEGALDLVVLEAMASGLPCVLSDVACVREAVEHGVTGLLTRFEDAGAFAASLTQLVRDREQREAMGARAAQVAQERFEIRDRMPLYSAAYQRAVDEAILPSQLPAWHEMSLEWLTRHWPNVSLTHRQQHEHGCSDRS